MNRLTVAFLFCLISNIVNAGDAIELQKPVLCSDLKTVIEFVTGPKFKEQPTWTGADDLGKYILTQNDKTGTWTLIQYSEGIACILGTGERGQLIFLNKTRT